MGVGRPSIERGEYWKRAFWDNVNIGDALDPAPDGPIPEPAKEHHWYWSGSPRGVAGVTRSTYDRPVRVLYYEMREDEWDTRPGKARLVNKCGMDDCINPWHAEWSLTAPAEDPVTRARMLTDRELLDSLGDSDKTAAWTLYADVIDNWAVVRGAVSPKSMHRIQFTSDVLLKRINKALGEERWFESDLQPMVIALVEYWLNSDKAPTSDEARAEIVRRVDARRAAREDALAKVDARVKARESKNKKAPTAVRPIKPRPRR